MTCNEGDPHQTSGDDAARRSFLVRFAAVVCGGIVALFPFAAGLGVIIDPLRRSRRGGSGNDESSGKKFVRICPLDALPADGTPQAFPVVTDDVDDAWTRAANQRVGMLFLHRTGSGKGASVVAFTADVPALGLLCRFQFGQGAIRMPVSQERHSPRTAKSCSDPACADSINLM